MSTEVVEWLMCLSSVVCVVGVVNYWSVWVVVCCRGGRGEFSRGS